MPARIMVVNDTQEILELFEDLLTDEGYEVALYSFGIEDLDEVERVNPDLIILDYIIGGEAVGWQMLQKLKMRRSTARIPVIVCTAAKNQVQEMEGYLKSKGVGLVLKPFDIGRSADGRQSRAPTGTWARAVPCGGPDNAG